MANRWSKWLYQRSAWLAVLVIFFSAVIPTASPLYAAANNQAIWVEICTTAATKYVALDLGPQQDASTQEHAASSGHCPFCLAPDHAPALAPSLATPLFLLSSNPFRPLLTAAPQPLGHIPLHAHRSRAPPVFS